MRLGNQSGPGHFFLWCFSSRPQRGTEERREMFHSFCKYLGQDFLKLASWYPNILSSQEAPAEDPIPFKYCLCFVSDLSLEDTATATPDQQSSSRGGDAEQNSFPYKRRVSGRVCYFEGFGCYFLFYTQLSVLVNSTNILIFLTSQFFTVKTLTLPTKYVALDYTKSLLFEEKSARGVVSSFCKSVKWPESSPKWNRFRQAFWQVPKLHK